MTTSQSSTLQLAKQGNPHAIATLINRSLQSKGITAKVALKNDCLKVLLEPTQSTDRELLNKFICKGVFALGNEAIKVVEVYGKEAGASTITWKNKFELNSQSFTSLDEITDSSYRKDESAGKKESQINVEKKDEIYYRKFVLFKSKFSPRVSPNNVISEKFFDQWSKTNENIIDNLVKELLRISNEDLIDLLEIRYKGNSSYLVLTNKNIRCLSFSHSSKRMSEKLETTLVV